MKSYVCCLATIALFLMSLAVHGQLSEGLLVHYTLNGNLNDASGNGYDASTLGEASYVSDSFGNIESALLANGINRYADFPETDALEVGFPLTLSARVRFNAISGTQIVACTDFAENTHSGAWIQISTNGLITAAYGNANGGFSGSTRQNKFGNFALETNTWYQITAIFNGPSDIDIYMGCELLTGFYEGFANTIGYTDAPGSLCRKRANAGSVPPFYLSGALDDFRYWDRALTEEEITILCNEGDPLATSCEDFKTYLSDVAADGTTAIYGVDYTPEAAELSLITAIDEEVHIAYSTDNGLIYAFNKLDGAYRTISPEGAQGPLQSLSIPVTEITGATMADEGEFFISSQSMNTVFRVNASTGETTVVDSYSPLLGGDLVYINRQVEYPEWPDNDELGPGVYLILATREGGGTLLFSQPNGSPDFPYISLPALVTGIALAPESPTAVQPELLVSERGADHLFLLLSPYGYLEIPIFLNGAPFTLSDGDLASGCAPEIAVPIPTNEPTEPFELTAYPNPTNGSILNFKFTLQADDEVTLQIVDFQGEVRTVLQPGLLKANKTQVLKLDVGNLRDGIYLYKLAGSTVSTSGRIAVSKR